MNIADRIKKRRKELNMTQESLAKAVGLATVSIRQYESGKREPKFEQLLKISEVLLISPSYLLTGDVNIPTDFDADEALKKAAASAQANLSALRDSANEAGTVSLKMAESVAKETAQSVAGSTEAFAQLAQAFGKLSESDRDAILTLASSLAKQRKND